MDTPLKPLSRLPALPPFQTYVLRRLALDSPHFRELPETQRATLILARAFLRPFEATSFRRFWEFWNPVYGYFLGRFVYSPLKRVFPRSACVVLTFAFSGFVLHDLPAWLISGAEYPACRISSWFTTIALGIIASDGLRLSFDGSSRIFRALLHALFLASTLYISIWLRSMIK